MAAGIHVIEVSRRTTGPEAEHWPGDHFLLADLHKTGYKADHTLESLREVERFINENPSLFAGKSDSLIFPLEPMSGRRSNICTGVAGLRMTRTRRASCMNERIFPPYPHLNSMSQ